MSVNYLIMILSQLVAVFSVVVECKVASLAFYVLDVHGRHLLADPCSGRETHHVAFSNRRSTGAPVLTSEVLCPGRVSKAWRRIRHKLVTNHMFSSNVVSSLTDNTVAETREK